MKDEWITPYVQNLREEVQLPGSNSCSKMPTIALKFALDKEYMKPNHIPTLFVINCRNYDGIAGMALNNEAYTAYPSECEVLLAEGCAVFVLTVDRDVVIKASPVGQMACYDGKSITIIHLYHNW